MTPSQSGSRVSNERLAEMTEECLGHGRLYLFSAPDVGAVIIEASESRAQVAALTAELERSKNALKDCESFIVKLGGVMDEARAALEKAP